MRRGAIARPGASWRADRHSAQIKIAAAPTNASQIETAIDGRNAPQIKPNVAGSKCRAA
jgi:hypothetical protein